MGTHPFDIRHFAHPIVVTHRPEGSFVDQPTVIRARKLVAVPTEDPSVWLMVVKFVPRIDVGDGQRFVFTWEGNFNI